MSVQGQCNGCLMEARQVHGPDVDKIFTWHERQFQQEHFLVHKYPFIHPFIHLDASELFSTQDIFVATEMDVPLFSWNCSFGTNEK